MNVFSVGYRTYDGGIRLQKRCLSGHLHFFADRAHLELYVDARRFAGVQNEEAALLVRS